MMKTNRIKKILSVLLAGAMVICLSAAAGVPAKAYADEAEDGGKYVSDVFIAYGKTEKEATKWLEKNGWEPVKGDFNAGKASFWDDNKVQDQNVAAVMGIRRTNDKNGPQGQQNLVGLANKRPGPGGSGIFRHLTYIYIIDDYNFGPGH